MKIDNSRVISTGSASKDRLPLRSATEVHWSWRKHDSVETRRLHAVLSILPTLPYIRLLSLYHADINHAQQAIIFGLSTLRTLVVHTCRFHPPKKRLPISGVTDLRLTNTDMQTTRRLLTILATTVESLELIYYGDPIVSTLQDGLIELPKISSFAMVCHHQAHGLAIWDTFNQYKSITTIYIPFHHYLPEVSFHHSVLPALRHVTCSQNLAVTLIPQRPVTTYVEARSRPEGGRGRLLNSLSKARAKITNLKISVSDHLYSLLLSLATSLLDLEQLSLSCYRNGVVWLGASPPDHLLWYNPPGAAPVILPKLKWVTILLGDDQFKPPYMSSEWLRNKYFIPVCPALEVFECLCVPFYNLECNFVLPPEPDRAWMTRRLPDGSWERQGPPPIPSPYL